MIRQATPADAGAVLALWAVAAAGTSVTDDQQGLRVLLATDGDALLVAEAEGRVVGTLVAAFDGWRGNLYRLAVLPGYRRRGVGIALVREGERRLRGRGARRVTALVVAGESGATAFWEAVGYHHDPRTSRHARTL